MNLSYRRRDHNMAKMIQVKELRLIRLNVDQNPFATADADAPTTQEITFDLLTPADKKINNCFIMILQIKGEAGSQKGMPAGPSYEVHGVAEFETPDGLSPAQQRGLVVLNGGMILYGLIRGQMSLITGALPGGSILLPAVDWKATVDEIEARRRGASEAGQPKVAAPLPSPDEPTSPGRSPKKSARKPKATPSVHPRKPRSK